MSEEIKSEEIVADKQEENLEESVTDDKLQSDIEAQVEENPQADKEKKKTKYRGLKLYLLGVLSGIMVMLIISTGYILYEQYGLMKQLAEAKEESLKEEEPEEAQTIVKPETTVKMASIEKLIKEEFYKDVDLEKLENGVYSGMLSSLEDPYSVYYDKKKLREVLEEGEGIYYGIGAYISIDKETNAPVIAGIISGTPAEEAGIEEGDIIAKVDGVDSTRMTTSEVVKLIKGPEHTTVLISFIREGESDYIDVEVERRKIESPTVNYEMKEDNIGYIQITEFDDVTTDQFTEAMAVLKGQGMEGLILDLRSNGGGNLTTCVAIASQLLPEGLIVYTEDKSGNREEYTCDGTREIEIPLVVLVNGYSASASEILTGAIKDHKKGTIMGTTTYGKGIVQTIIPFRDGTAIKITTSSYYTPSGKNIHGVGIEPDIEVTFDGEAYKKDKSDNQLDAAIEKIKQDLE